MRISYWSSDVCSSDLADRLGLGDGGAATEFKGSLDDYTAFVLSQGKAEKAGGGDKPAKINRKDERRLAAEARERSQSLRKNVQEAERETARLARRRSEIDRAMFDPSSAEKADQGKRSEEHTSELQSLMRSSYAVYCLQKHN